MYDSSYLDKGHDSLAAIGRFYHASPHRFNVGDVLVPQPPSKRNFACSAGFVYLTDDRRKSLWDAPAPQYCIEAIAREEGWYVYRVQPLSAVHPGIAQDLVCESARVLECLGVASSFQGDSRVTMSSSYHALRTKLLSQPDASRIRLAERALGAHVIFRGAGDQKRRRGRVIFADYDTLNVLVDTGKDCQRLVSLRDCQVLALRDVPVPVLHGARLDVWQHGEGWRGVGIADLRVADSWLEPLLAVAA